MAGFLIFLRFCQQRVSRFFAVALVFALSMMLLSCGGGSVGGASGPVADGITISLTPPPPVALPGISLLAGALGGSGNANGTGTGGRFNTPLGITADSDHNFYVADALNQVIRKITPAGVITTLAGTPGQAGSSNGTGGAALFNSPVGLAVDAGDNIYVADSGNNAIRKITPGATPGDPVTVTTLAGGTKGSLDGTGTNASFNTPSGLAVDATGNVYVTDSLNHTIRVITPGGVVSTLAGLPGNSGFADGSGSTARFSLPVGIAIDGSGNLYVADAGNHEIRKITMPAGVVSTFAGGFSNSGSTNGPVASALFDSPGGVALAGDKLYVSDSASHTLRVIDISAGVVSTLAGSAGISGSIDSATGSAARFNTPVGIAFDAGGSLYVTDSQNHAIRMITPAGAVTTFAGLMEASGSTDGTGGVARFKAPAGIAVDQDGALVVADTSNHTIRSVTMAGAVTTLAGSAGVPGAVSDSDPLLSRFDSPLGVASDAVGNHYVADTVNRTVRKISSAGVVTTLAGKAGTSAGSADGTGETARFNAISGIGVDTAGYVYVTDVGSHTIRKITPAGVVTTLAGLAGVSGATDGVGSAARFSFPAGIAVSVTGTVYVADTGSHTIRMISPAGKVTTLAGTAGVPGALDATGTSAKFNGPIGLAVDADNNLYVADTNNNTLRKITAVALDANGAVLSGGEVTTIAGVAGSSGVALGLLPGGLNAPSGLAIGLDGNLYTSSENSILKVTLAAPINRFGVSLQASSTSILLDQSFSLHWAATNATPASCVASGDWSGSKAVSGSVNITLTVPGTVTYNLECTELGTESSASPVKKMATVTMTPITPVPTVSLSASSTQLTLGESLTLSWSSKYANTTCTASTNPTSTHWAGSKPANTSDSLTFTPILGSRIYSFACTGDGGTTSKSVAVAVTVMPVATLSASSSSITEGQNITLTWSSANTTSCSSWGAWSGSRPPNGSLLVTPAAGNQTYNLLCTGAGGTVSKTVTIAVAALPPAPAPASSAGLFDMEALFGLGALAMLRRYFSGQEDRLKK